MVPIWIRTNRKVHQDQTESMEPTKNNPQTHQNQPIAAPLPGYLERLAVNADFVNARNWIALGGLDRQAHGLGPDGFEAVAE